MNRWYAALCKPRQETVAEANLVNQGFAVYLPRLTSARRRAGRWVDVVEPLFPRYLFVAADLETKSLAPIRSTRGVSGLVRFGGQPAVVPDNLIEALRRREDSATGLHVIERPLFVAGDRVKLLQGPLSGLEGVFAAETGDLRVIVLMEMLGRLNRLEVSRDWVAAAA
jgi:transcriptional antiterminator RfaH